MTRCARPQCGRTIAAPRPRQLYCDVTCSDAERQQRKRNRTRTCKNCDNKTPERFCSNECRWAYLKRIRKSNKTPVAEREAAVVVLLPVGCKPTPLRLSELPVNYGEIARKVFCRRMERCLSYAVSKKWGGLSCMECDVDEPEEPDIKSKGSNWEW